MLLLGIDVGTSSVKVSVVDAFSQQCISTAQYPETEAAIISRKTGWAEQSAGDWWHDVQKAIQLVQQVGSFDPHDIGAIGISYQMHGLVLVDEHNELLRDSIIWCDSRAVRIGEAAFDALGSDYCLGSLLNSPGNFTAAKLAWVKANEPDIYGRIHKVMLPGDYIALKLTGELTTSVSALSEGIFYDFKAGKLSAPLLNYFGFDESMFANIQPVFSYHGELKATVAQRLNLKAGIPVSYKAGDQPNNALSLNVLNPGEVAATAGTSGVIYAVSDTLGTDAQSRINTFAHVNYAEEAKRLGVLLCINGTGSLNRWAKNTVGIGLTYSQMNAEAGNIAIGSDGLLILPFGNGAERMLGNKLVGAHIENIDLNLHTRAHILRAAQEGIACSFRYGLDIMRENGIKPTVIKAGLANMFLSEVFTQAFVNVTGVPVELYNNDGSVGAALGAGIGAAVYTDANEAFSNLKPLKVAEPQTQQYEPVYQQWKELLLKHLA